MVPAYLVSLLTRQVSMLKKDGFLQRHPHPWLVWEPGTWEPPRSATESDVGKTRLPDTTRPERPAAGDALCFELVVKGKEQLFRVGRSSDCEIVLNDMTISREQFHISFDGQKWSLVPLPNAKTTLSAGEVTKPITLSRRETIKAGGLTLTFAPAAEFLSRLG